KKSISGISSSIERYRSCVRTNIFFSDTFWLLEVTIEYSSTNLDIRLLVSSTSAKVGTIKTTLLKFLADIIMSINRLLPNDAGELKITKAPDMSQFNTRACDLCKT